MHYVATLPRFPLTKTGQTGANLGDHTQTGLDRTRSANPRGRCLIAASRLAEMLVIGSHGRGAFTGMLAGFRRPALRPPHDPVLFVC